MVTSSVESVRMAFYTDEEVRGMSVKEITTPILFDNLGRPVSGGLFDPAMGPWKDEPASCKTCGEPPLHCPGHCGHINLVLPVYNPLLFKTLRKLLRLTCFFCNHLMINKERVKIFTTKLELIMKGDVLHARNLDSMVLGVSNLSGKGEEHVGECSKGSTRESLFMEQQSWTSLQYSEAKTIFKDIMTEASARKCGKCGARNPKISCPGFGLLYKEGLAMKDIQSNFIRASVPDGPDLSSACGKEKKFITDENQTGEFFNEPSGGELSDNITDVEQQSKSKSRKGRMKKMPDEFLNQQNYFDKKTYLTPLQVQDMLKLLWKNEHDIFSLIWALQPNFSTSTKNTSFSMFFLQALVVPPSRFRPPNEINTSPQNFLLSKVLQSNISLVDSLKDTKPGHSISLQNLNRWIQLQESVSVLFDSSKATSRREKTVKGICQILEKKDGLFRQNMMGKRVNFACRSVISPDPYLAVNEIGIPPYFAMRLTYPEKVTPWNADRLRKAILNGPYVYPGALRVEDVHGVTHLDRPVTRRAIAKKLCSSSVVSGQHRLEGKVVHRHLQDGDILLVNRQPTLHKPSMMAHVARVLKGEKTLRMHYANCSTYNADFDGDEMNVHFPQDEIARAEAYNIVNANEQYIVPTKGEPIRGLIQDHIASSVLLTKKDTFLTREEYHHLLYSSCGMVSQGESNQKCCMIKSEGDIHPILPAIWKPYPLWTGKQIITTILNHVVHDLPPFTVENVAKIHDYNIIPKGCQGDANTLHRKCLISKNEFLYGIIDKAQYGKFGLVHMVQELYGENTAGLLLSILSRLFTAFLQMHGFTCGVDDLLLISKEEILRTESIRRCESIGESVHSKFIGVEYDRLDPMSLQREIENVLRTNGESATERLDALMSSELNELTNELNKKLFPAGLLKPFPNNCVFLMTGSGAKGSNVNLIQISSLLGQQELEGKRVPRMVSGKTLPCFPPWDTAPRAGGFISDRFLTGLHPQEYYFHCMAGREGLVDTAIKTSRSGYLQRCLVKNLECLKICYDYTVRDADGSIVQFYYGEDGVDVLKSSCLGEFKILAANQEILQERLGNGHSVDSDLLESNSYISCLPELLQRKAENFIGELPEDQKGKLKLRKPKKFMNLVKLKYATSLAHAGEAVGVIAAQSIGEPSTQMT
ncbi:unnamed protein product [Victoria cruziana]